MSDAPSVLQKLNTQFDAITAGRHVGGNSSAVHAAILDRLAANRRTAAAAGWTGLENERAGGFGWVRLFGIAPGEQQRREVPDVA